MKAPVEESDFTWKSQNFGDLIFLFNLSLGNFYLNHNFLLLSSFAKVTPLLGHESAFVFVLPVLDDRLANFLKSQLFIREPSIALSHRAHFGLLPLKLDLFW